MGTLTKGLISLEDTQGGQGTFDRKTSTGGTQTVTKVGLPRRINLLDYVSLTDSDHTSGIQAALDAASPRETDGSAKTSEPLSTNEAWAYSGIVEVPAATYYATQIKVPHGVRFLGAGPGGFGLKKGFAVTRFQQLQSAASGDFVIFQDRNTDDASFIEIANMVFLGPRDGDTDSDANPSTFVGTATNNGIRVYGTNAAADIHLNEVSIFRNLNIRGFGGDAIQMLDGFDGVNLRDIVINFCGNYGLNIGTINNITSYNGFTATNIRINSAILGGIYIHDLAQNNGTTSGGLTFRGIYNEMGVNTAYNQSAAGSPYDTYAQNPLPASPTGAGDPVGRDAFIIKDCDNTPITIDGLVHSADNTGTGVSSPNRWSPRAGILIQSSDRTDPKVPNLIVNGLSVRNHTQQAQGKNAPGFALIDTSRGSDTSPWTDGILEAGTDPLTTGASGANTTLIVTLGASHGVEVGDELTIYGATDLDNVSPNGTWRVTAVAATTATVQTTESATTGGVAGGGDWVEVIWTYDLNAAAQGTNCRVIEKELRSFKYGRDLRTGWISERGSDETVYTFGDPTYRDSDNNLRPHVQIGGTKPGIAFHDEDGSDDERRYELLVNSGNMEVRTVDDTGADQGTAWLKIDGNGDGGSPASTEVNTPCLLAKTFCGSQVTIADDDLTWTVTSATQVITSANTTPAQNVSSITGNVGQFLLVRGGSSTNQQTIPNSGNFNLSADFSPTVDDTLFLWTPDGTSWYEISRSVN